MRASIQSLHVEGPAATFDPSPDRIAGHCRSGWRFWARDHQVGPV